MMSNKNNNLPFTDHSTQPCIRANELPEGETLKLIESLRKIPTKPPEPNEPKPAKSPWDFANLD
jgi:hypothetical protein